jgi:hypothetical protein
MVAVMVLERTCVFGVWCLEYLFGGKKEKDQSFYATGTILHVKL